MLKKISMLIALGALPAQAMQPTVIMPQVSTCSTLANGNNVMPQGPSIDLAGATARAKNIANSGTVTGFSLSAARAPLALITAASIVAQGYCGWYNPELIFTTLANATQAGFGYALGQHASERLAPQPKNSAKQACAAGAITATCAAISSFAPRSLANVAYNTALGTGLTAAPAFLPQAQTKIATKDETYQERVTRIQQEQGLDEKGMALGLLAKPAAAIAAVPATLAVVPALVSGAVSSAIAYVAPMIANVATTEALYRVSKAALDTVNPENISKANAPAKIVLDQNRQKLLDELANRINRQLTLTYYKPVQFEDVFFDASDMLERPYEPAGVTIEINYKQALAHAAQLIKPLLERFQKYYFVPTNEELTYLGLKLYSFEFDKNFKKYIDSAFKGIMSRCAQGTTDWDSQVAIMVKEVPVVFHPLMTALTLNWLTKQLPFTLIEPSFIDTLNAAHMLAVQRVGLNDQYASFIKSKAIAHSAPNSFHEFNSTMIVKELNRYMYQTQTPMLTRWWNRMTTAAPSA